MPLSGWPVVTNDSGTGQDGTVINEAFFDAIRASIEDEVFGTTNPSVGASAIIDEVVQARGSVGSLDGRLDVSLENTGELKPLEPQPLFYPGAAAVADGVVGGAVNAQTSAVGNSGAAETNLMVYTLQANHFNTNNKAVRIVAFGTYANNANAKTIRFYVGASNIFSFAHVLADHHWKAEVILMRASATTGSSTSRIETGPITDNPIVDNRLLNTAGIAHTWTGAALLRFTGQGVASSDIVQLGMVVEALN
jgi:hypothetical protein